MPAMPITDLLAVETRILHGIYDTEGEAAFDRSARRLLFHTAGLVAHVSGRQRLRDIMDAIERTHPIQ
jgi:CRISPR/Cas system-associated protein Csx1